MNALLSTLALAYRTLLRNPRARGWVVLGSVFYLLSPIDLSPDLIPILGQIDDVALVVLLFSELSRMALDGWRNRFGAAASASEDERADRDYTQTIDVAATPPESTTAP